MVMSRQKGLERLETRSGNIFEHFEKIVSDSESHAIGHWKVEIRNWIREMEHALPHVGKKTGDAWEKLIHAYNRVLEEVP
jgi:hypothetical protein